MARIEWLGHASFRIVSAGKTIYIDPWKIQHPEPKADLILISHSHFDHLSVDDVRKLSKPDTQIVCARDCAGQLAGRVHTLAPGQSVEVGGITIKGVRAYNPAKEFHPKAQNWLGFLVTIDGETIYYAGDTDLIPEMHELGPVDIALLPIGGTYTMSADEAARAAAAIKPRVKAIPYHYGDIVGSDADAEAFRKACTACPTERLASTR